MDASSIPITELLPHGPEMALIDCLLSYSEAGSVAAVKITPDSEFLEASGVPCWVGIEYMAQTIAAHAGIEAREQKVPPPIGFLLGTRAFKCDVEAFPLGSELKIVVTPLFVESSLSAFECSIELDRVIATAVLNTYQPSDEMLRQIGKD